MSCPSLMLYQPRRALKIPMLTFLFLEWNLCNTTASRAAHTAGRGIEQKGQKSPVGNGGTALGPIPGPCSLAEKPTGVEGNLVPDIQQSPGSSQASFGSQLWGFYSTGGWRYRTAGSTQSDRGTPWHYVTSSQPNFQLMSWLWGFILLLKINKIPKVTGQRSYQHTPVWLLPSIKSIIELFWMWVDVHCDWCESSSDSEGFGAATAGPLVYILKFIHMKCLFFLNVNKWVQWIHSIADCRVLKIVLA